MTANVLISDLLLRIKQENDDAFVETSQLYFWLATTRDALVTQYLDELLMRGRAIDSFYVERLTGVRPVRETSDNLEVEEERMVIALPKEPMNLFNENGVVRVTTTEGDPVYKTRLEAVEFINDLPFSRAKPTRLLYYRDGRNVVIEGLSYVNNKTLFNVQYVPYLVGPGVDRITNDGLVSLLDSPFSIHDALVSVLLNSVEEIAKRQLYVNQPNVNNDGVDDTQPMRLYGEPE